MSRVLPYKGLSIDRFTALVKANNPKTQLPSISFVFSNVSPTVGDSVYNSVTGVTPKKVSSSGDGTAAVHPLQEVAYNRLSLGALSLMPESEINPITEVELPFTIHEILDKINDAFGLTLIPEEVVDYRYETRSDLYKLEIENTNNLAWLPGTIYQFPVQLVGDNLARLMEDNTHRLVENGEWRHME